jgi:hypothetical protein
MTFPDSDPLGQNQTNQIYFADFIPARLSTESYIINHVIL